MAEYTNEDLAKAIKQKLADFEQKLSELRKTELAKSQVEMCPTCGNEDQPDTCTCLKKNLGCDPVTGQPMGKGEKKGGKSGCTMCKSARCKCPGGETKPEKVKAGDGSGKISKVKKNDVPMARPPSGKNPGTHIPVSKPGMVKSDSPASSPPSGKKGVPGLPGEEFGPGGATPSKPSTGKSPAQTRKELAQKHGEPKCKICGKAKGCKCEGTFKSELNKGVKDIDFGDDGKPSPSGLEVDEAAKTRTHAPGFNPMPGGPVKSGLQVRDTSKQTFQHGGVTDPSHAPGKPLQTGLKLGQSSAQAAVPARAPKNTTFVPANPAEGAPELDTSMKGHLPGVANRAPTLPGVGVMPSAKVGGTPPPASVKAPAPKTRPGIFGKLFGKAEFPSAAKPSPAIAGMKSAVADMKTQVAKLPGTPPPASVKAPAPGAAPAAPKNPIADMKAAVADMKATVKSEKSLSTLLKAEKCALCGRSEHPGACK